MGLFTRGTKPTVTKDMRAEVGVAGEVVFEGFNKEESRTDRVSITEYREMLDKDPTVESLFSIFTLPIIAATYRIDADKDDVNEEQAERVRKNLFEPPHKGGMQTPFSLFLDQANMSIIDGFQLWEKVYRIDEDGKYSIKKLAHRDSVGLTLIRDDESGYNGARQIVSYGDRSIDVVMPAHKTFLLTHNKARSFLYGRSAFTSLRAPYIKKRKLEYLDSIALQADAIKPKILRRISEDAAGKDESKSTLVAKTLNALSKLGEIKSVASIPFGYEVQELAQKGRDPHQSIERQNSEMARAFMATFSLMSSQGSSNGGNFALSDNLKDMLMISLKAYMTKLEEHINQYMIADLIELNYPQPRYPEFHFDDLTSDTIQAIADAFQKLLEKDRISDEMVQGIEEATANRLEIDIEKIKKDREKAAVERANIDASVVDEEDEDPKPPLDKGGTGGDAGRFLADQDAPARDITEAEKAVKFEAINSWINKGEERFQDLAAKELNSYIATVSKAPDQEIVLPASYVKLLESTYKDAYNFGKLGAADEQKLPAPEAKKLVAEHLKRFVGFVVDKQTTDIKLLVSEQRLKLPISLADEEQPTASLLSSFITAAGLVWIAQAVLGTKGTIVSQGLNDGRNDAFRSFDKTQKGGRTAYQWSSLLETNTCAVCRNLDKSTIAPEDFANTPHNPQKHFNCRCLWVRVHTDSDTYQMPEIDPPDDDELEELQRIQSTRKQELINDGTLKTGSTKKQLLDQKSGTNYTGMTLDDVETSIRPGKVETVIALDDKGVVIGSNLGTKSQAALPAELVKAVTNNNSIVTHNHPSGNAFSLTDLKTAASLKLGEIRAAGSTGYTYSAKPGVNGWPSANELSKAYTRNRDVITKKYQPYVRNGGMTADEANLTTSHEIWVNVSKELGFTYERIGR